MTAPQPESCSPCQSSGDGPSVNLDDPESRLSPASRRWLADTSRRAVAMLARAGEARVRVVGDPEMAAAHERYQGIAGTTDVLTFDMTDSPAGPAATPGHPSGRVLDADILVCFDEAARQGAARSHAPERELLLYIVHGVLHCLGHDDHDAGAAARMHAVEDQVLSALGVGATYAREPGEGQP
jgi:probable rRNA maturation factor